MSEIASTVWPEVLDPGMVNRKRVEQVVSEVRDLLGDGGRAAIPQRQHERYRLVADPDAVWVDAQVFRSAAAGAKDALERGDHARARTMALQALALWHAGPVVLTEEWRELHRRRREVRLTAAEAALQGPEIGNAVSELASYVDDHGDDERGWELLVEALMRTGRVTDARRTCTEARTTLASHGGAGPRLGRMCAELSRAGGEPPPVTPPSPPQDPTPPVEVTTPAPTRPGHRVTRRRAWAAVAAVGVAVVALAANAVLGTDEPPSPRVSPATEPPSVSVPPAPAAPTMGHDGLLYDFEAAAEGGGGGSYLDATAGRSASVRTAVGGVVSTVPHADGKAIKFPDHCPSTEPARCPRAVVQVADAEMLNPGARPFEYGADLLVRAVDIAGGANVLQKGVAGRPTSMWKLEIGERGTVRCILVVDGVRYNAESERVIGDGEWHRARCRRTGSALSLELDGSSPRTVPLPAGLVVDSPGLPLTFGGPSEQAVRERYSGALDNVFYALT